MIKPDWNEIALKIGDDLEPAELNVEWRRACDNWLLSVANEFEGSYRIESSENFSILSNENERYVNVFTSFLEQTLKKILKTLNGIASDEGFGNHVAIIFENIDDYYKYVGMFYPDEGEFGLSSGMYINEGYGHFVFPSQEVSYAEPIAVHELTHACLAHLPIPVWLNEGLAVSMEEALAGIGLYVDADLIARHKSHWNSETIQNFWSGDGFYASSEEQELSYNLAHILVKNLCEKFDIFIGFTNNANFEDAGESAAKEFLGVSLSDVIVAFLGEGNWTPSKNLKSIFNA